ncbi:hypothetical protein [Sinomicrobium sp. M5D2P17]
MKKIDFEKKEGGYFMRGSYFTILCMGLTIYALGSGNHMLLA